MATFRRLLSEAEQAKVWQRTRRLLAFLLSFAERVRSFAAHFCVAKVSAFSELEQRSWSLKALLPRRRPGLGPDAPRRAQNTPSPPAGAVLTFAEQEQQVAAAPAGGMSGLTFVEQPRRWPALCYANLGPARRRGCSTKVRLAVGAAHAPARYLPATCALLRSKSERSEQEQEQEQEGEQARACTLLTFA